MKKEKILREIVRTARKNRGRPLGVRRFAKETGITQSVWSEHWPKFSDAQQEAGFEPNKPTPAYDKSFLTKLLISLIRELGHFPTDTELRVKCHNTGFPSAKTFRSERIGRTKADKAKNILAYCEGKPEYQDVVMCCTEICDASREEVEDDYDDAETKSGYVYMMKTGRYYKIGETKNPVGKRQYDIGIKLPEPLVLVHQIKTDDKVGLQGYWHRRFDKKRVRYKPEPGGRDETEWFCLSSSDVKLFKRRRSQYFNK